ncbi:inorganic phosphate transporter [Erwinia sp. PK3-005]|uniref:Phosphate transporter n=1 Tax=Mixta hanseatica TaxID=2872648 RepID=A0ABY4RFV4_9GAMM|nr:inorganic phosphate transporter [Mixta hanseatica]UQY45439.1 inorganic phosphate transporter [Mixta hanseatica]
MSDYSTFARYTSRFPTLYPARSVRRQRLRALVAGLLLLVAIGWMMAQLSAEMSTAGNLFSTRLLLGCALLLALGFVFVNGMHDTANAVTTVIYTGTLSPGRAVLISAVANMLGVLLASGVVAWGVMSLLPAEGLLQVDTRHGYALIFALLLAAIGWNLTSWYFAIPSSSSHALLGAMLGVGCASSLLNGNGALGGIDWHQAGWAGWALLLSPLLGFVVAGLLLLVMKALVPNRQLIQPADLHRPPPLWLRGMLLLTSSGVSFAHGANDGQKGMGLIMVILLIALPGGFALNRTLPEQALTRLSVLAAQAQAQLPQRGDLTLSVAERELQRYLQQPRWQQEVLPALGTVTGNLHQRLNTLTRFDQLSTREATRLRLQMSLIGKTLHQLLSGPAPLTRNERSLLTALAGQLNQASGVIPWWVKIMVALALGAGTLTGWQRIAITIGERTGKAPLSAAQGASSELVTMTTLGVAEQFGLPVSTTQVLTCGVAGSMVANRSALQWRTLKRMGLVWLLTLPVCALMAALVYTLLVTL